MALKGHQPAVTRDRDTVEYPDSQQGFAIGQPMKSVPRQAAARHADGYGTTPGQNGRTNDLRGRSSPAFDVEDRTMERLQMRTLSRGARRRPLRFGECWKGERGSPAIYAVRDNSFSHLSRGLNADLLPVHASPGPSLRLSREPKNTSIEPRTTQMSAILKMTENQPPTCRPIKSVTIPMVSVSTRLPSAPAAMRPAPMSDLWPFGTRDPPPKTKDSKHGYRPQNHEICCGAT